MLQLTLARVVVTRQLYVGQALASFRRSTTDSREPSFLSGEPETTRRVYEPTYHEEEEDESGYHNSGSMPKARTTDPPVLPTPPFSSSPKILSVGVAPPVEPVVQQKRHDAEASCADLDGGSPWKDQEETAAGEDDSDLEYYRRHKASPLSHVKFVDTRKPITRATDGTADSSYYGGVPDTVGWRPEQLDTAEEALLRAARIWKESAMAGDPDAPQSRVLRALRGEA